MPKQPPPSKDSLKAAAVERPPAATRPTKGLAVAGNLVACVLVGMLLGWGVDWLTGTKPWGLIVGFGLGFAAWLRELWGLLKTP